MEGSVSLHRPDKLLATSTPSEDEEAFSPASSVISTTSSCSAMSVTSDATSDMTSGSTSPPREPLPLPSPLPAERRVELSEQRHFVRSADLFPSYNPCKRRIPAWSEEGATCAAHNGAYNCQSCARAKRRRSNPAPTSSPPVKPLPKATHKSEFNVTLQKDFAEAVEAADAEALTSMLRDHSEKIDLNRFNEEGRTPLQHFCMAGDLGLVKLLVQFGADTRLRTLEGWSILHIASFSSNPDMLAYVMKCNTR